MRRAAALGTALLLACLSPARAGQSVGGSVGASDDSEGTTVLRTTGHWDFRYEGNDDYRGVEYERARFAPTGGPVTTSDRLFVRFADSGAGWKWRGRIGTDGDTWLGSASVHNEAPRRQEYFIERDVVETPLGLEHDVHATFAGAAYDLPLDERNMLTALVGVQAFTGGNRRLHLRGRYIRVLSETWGLSAQLRARHFSSSDPHQFDYYSPRWHAEVMPVLQLRRFHEGWMFVAAAGAGRQADSASGWRDARLLEASVTSPADEVDWRFKASLEYSTTPSAGIVADGYSYRMFRLEASKAF